MRRDGEAKEKEHNLLHFLVTVVLRVVYTGVLVPIAVYVLVVGWWLSQETIGGVLPSDWKELIEMGASRLPYEEEAKKWMFLKLGEWYKGAPAWWTMVVGIPLILLGGGLFLISFFNLYYTLFSRVYNRTHCPFCKEPEKTED